VIKARTEVGAFGQGGGGLSRPMGGIELWQDFTEDEGARLAWGKEGRKSVPSCLGGLMKGDKRARAWRNDQKLYY